MSPSFLAISTTSIEDIKCIENDLVENFNTVIIMEDDIMRIDTPRPIKSMLGI